MANQKRALDEWEVEEILDAARTMVWRLSDGVKQRVRNEKGPRYPAPAMVDANQLRRLIEVLEPKETNRG